MSIKNGQVGEVWMLTVGVADRSSSQNKSPNRLMLRVTLQITGGKGRLGGSVKRLTLGFSSGHDLMVS